MAPRHGFRTRRLAALSTLVCAAALALAASAAAGPSAGGEWIVFGATPSGATVSQLFRIRPSGTGLQQLTHGPYASLAANFSPDGKRLAFARIGVGIFTMNVDGSRLHRLTTGVRDSFPTWSPDGKQLAFVRLHGAQWSVYVMPSAGGPQRRLSQAPPAGRPSWTPAGLLIPSGGDLLRIDPASGHVQKYYGADIDAVWGMNTAAVSPDSSTVTYVGARPPEPGDKECGDGLEQGPCQRFALYVEKILTKAPKPRRVSADVGPATFSPDGKQIVYPAHNGLVVRLLASGKSTTIPTGKAFPTVAAPPAWQPR